jgi:linoleoyl-CoA desaturase
VSWWTVGPVSASLGLAMAAIGFSIQHDGGHRAYSKYSIINRLAATSLDMLGGSSYYWARKHNVIHHTYPNITGHDDDIELGILGRLSPHQPHLKFHKLQHIYLWVLYGFISIKWQFYDDFRDLLRGRIGVHSVSRPKGTDLAIFAGGKLFFLIMGVVVPLMLHSWWEVLLVYMSVSFFQGVMLSIVFQMAHCVEEASFPMPESDTGRMTSSFAIHQIETTVDFAPDNRVLSWLVGGLNFQIEHHLFPQVCHIHYRAISPLVKETCREFGVRYNVHKSFLAGVASHYRWLRRMGVAEATT